MQFMRLTYWISGLVTSNNGAFYFFQHNSFPLRGTFKLRDTLLLEIKYWLIEGLIKE